MSDAYAGSFAEESLVALAGIRSATAAVPVQKRGSLFVRYDLMDLTLFF
jgi:hypothetical protein